MLYAWRTVSKFADFKKQPIWRAPKLEPVPPVSAIGTAINEPVPLVCWEFRERWIYDKRDKRRGRFVFGRLSTGSEWQPLEELPRYITVGDWA